MYTLEINLWSYIVQCSIKFIALIAIGKSDYVYCNMFILY